MKLKSVSIVLVDCERSHQPDRFTIQGSRSPIETDLSHAQGVAVAGKTDPAIRIGGLLGARVKDETVGIAPGPVSVNNPPP